MIVRNAKTVLHYVGDGTQKDWPVSFPFLLPTQVKVIVQPYKGAEETFLIYGSDYTVEPLQGAVGGVCHYSAQKGEYLTLYLDVPLEQSMDLRNSGVLDAELLERAFDERCLVDLQHTEILARCVKVNISSGESADELLKSVYVAQKNAQNAANFAAISKVGAEKNAQSALQSKVEVKALQTSTVAAVNSTGAEQKVLLENEGATQCALVRIEAQTQINAVKQTSADEKVSLKAIATQAEQSATASGASAGASAQSATEAKQYRDEAEQIVQFPVASETKLGGVKVGENLDVTVGGTLSIPQATETVKGVMKTATAQQAEERTANDVAITPATLPPPPVIPSSLPLGSVTMFSGSFGGANNKHPIPTGGTEADTNWHICDGSDNTPDLQGKFIVGAGAGYSQGDTGGATSASVSGNTGSTTLSASQMPSHKHYAGYRVSNDTAGSNKNEKKFFVYGNGSKIQGWDEATLAGAAFKNCIQIAPGFLPYTSTDGGGSSHSHSMSGAVATLPPYYALAYIIKVA